MLIIHPPVVDARSTYLGASTLAGKLRSQGIAHKTVDLNQHFFEYFFSKPTAQKLFQITQHPVFKYYSDVIFDLKQSLRSDAFYDDLTRIKSRNGLGLYCRLSSLAFPNCNLSLHSFSYNGVENDIKKLTASFECLEETPFNDFFRYWIRENNREVTGNVIAISVTNQHQLLPALWLAKILKLRGNEFVIGGATITKIKDFIVKQDEFFDCFDAAVFYEGEEIISTIAVGGIASLRQEKNIGSYALKLENKLYTEQKEHPTSPSSWTIPEFDSGALNLALRPDNVLPILTGKGCDWGHCTFCTIPQSSGQGNERFRDLSVSTAINNIIELEKNYKTKNFIFVDENMSLTRQLEVAEKILEHDVVLRWLAFARFENGYSPSNCRILRSSGCSKLLMGLESVSNKSLKRMKKGTSINVIKRNLETIIDAGIAVHLYCMVGFPGDEMSDAIATLEFVLELIDDADDQMVSASFSEFVLSRGSEISKNPKIYELVVSDNFDNELFHHKFEYCSGPSAEQWNQFRRIANKEIARKFAPNVMLGEEEYFLLLKGRKCGSPPNSENAHVIDVDSAALEKFRAAESNVLSFDACLKNDIGKIVVARESFRSLTLSSAAFEIFRSLGKGPNLAIDFRKLRAKQHGITEEEFTSVVNKCYAAELVDLSYLS